MYFNANSSTLSGFGGYSNESQQNKYAMKESHCDWSEQLDWFLPTKWLSKGPKQIKVLETTGRETKEKNATQTDY
jgi:hypothetical protein